MELAKIVEYFNRKLAGEMLDLDEMTVHLDDTIDDINQRLNTTFPAISELEDGATEYTAFPDRYIRSCLIVGGVWRFYQMDEEGATVAPEYQYQFQQNLFLMLRDYLPVLIRDNSEYLADYDHGVLHIDVDHPVSDGFTWNGAPFVRPYPNWGDLNG